MVWRTWLSRSALKLVTVMDSVGEKLSVRTVTPPRASGNNAIAVLPADLAFKVQCAYLWQQHSVSAVRKRKEVMTYILNVEEDGCTLGCVDTESTLSLIKRVKLWHHTDSVSKPCTHTHAER